MLALQPHELQVELVKLLPGSPLRRQAPQLPIVHDPHPPYTVLATPDMSFFELEKLRGISRLLDLTYNSGRFRHVFAALSEVFITLTDGLERLEAFWRSRDLFRNNFV